MSHITHFYHLAALDYINASHLGHPYNPSIGASDMLDGSASTGSELVASYVKALGYRRKCHTMGALIGGRHPMQNAIVPGGVTTLVNHANGLEALSQFGVLLNDVRGFINGTYLPNVLTVAHAYSATLGGSGGIQDYLTYGTGCGNLLAYGDFDVAGGAAGNLLIKRGRAHLGDVQAGVLTVHPVDQSKIVEFVGYSHYENFNILGGDAPSNTNYAHPWDGETKVQYEKAFTGGPSYSWMKAPRYLADGSEYKIGGGSTYATNEPIVYEVGPLPRMVVSYLANDTTVTVNDDATINLGLSPYTARQLVNKALELLTGVPTPGGLGGVHANVGNLWSVLGRHAARMLETKFLADAMSTWVAEVYGDSTSPAYTYIKIPKTLKKGVGLVEAPRGALGHWIKIEKKMVLKYQCIVPST